MQKISYLYAISAVLLWSTVATAFKIALSYMSVSMLLFIATFVSWSVLGILSIGTGEIRFLKTVEKKYIIRMIILGAINPFGYYLVLFEAYDILPAQEAQALNYTWALTLTYLSVFILKKELKKHDIISGLICYLGVFIIATRGDLFSFHFGNLYGTFLALFSTILWALYWIYNAKWRSYLVLGLFINFSSGLVLIGISLLARGDFANISLGGFLSASYVGVFEMGITFFLWLQALRYAKNTSKIANLIFLSPFLSLVFISIFLKESILYSTLIGLIFIIVGILFQQKSK